MHTHTHTHTHTNTSTHTPKGVVCCENICRARARCASQTKAVEHPEYYGVNGLAGHRRGVCRQGGDTAGNRCCKDMVNRASEPMT